MPFSQVVSMVAGALVAFATVAAAGVALTVSLRTRRWRMLLPILATLLLFASVSIQGVSLGFPSLRDFGSPWDGALWLAGMVLAFATYPDGRWVPRWIVVPVGGCLLLAVALVVSGGELMLAWWWTPAMAASLLLSAALIYRYVRRLTTAERESVRWAVLGFIVANGTMVVLVVCMITTRVSSISELGALAGVLAEVAPGLFPLALAIGLVRPRALDVDRWLYAVAVVAVAGPILALVFAGTVQLCAALGVPPVMAFWWAAAAAVVLTIPVGRLGSLTARALVYRGRCGPDEAVRRLVTELAATADPERASEVVAGVVAGALRVRAVEVDGPGVLFAARGAMVPGAQVSAVEVRRGDAVVGHIRLQPRAGESALTRADRAVLDALATAAAPALSAAAAFSELGRARARVILAREEERKRLRRDLHDGLAPTLVGLGLTADGIARMLRTRDSDLADVAGALARDTQDAVAQTREIAHGLRPRVLDDHGLTAAVRDRARADLAELDVEIAAPEDRLELPAAVELAALRIVQEAVANVRRHSGATSCRVSLGVRESALSVRVEDNGHGLPSSYVPGIGLESIGDRARELGGHATLGPSAMGGALVDVTIPIGAGS